MNLLSWKFPHSRNRVTFDTDTKKRITYSREKRRGPKRKSFFFSSLVIARLRIVSITRTSRFASSRTRNFAYFSPDSGVIRDLSQCAPVRGGGVDTGCEAFVSRLNAGEKGKKETKQRDSNFCWKNVIAWVVIRVRNFIRRDLLIPAKIDDREETYRIFTRTVDAYITVLRAQSCEPTQFFSSAQTSFYYLSIFNN